MIFPDLWIAKKVTSYTALSLPTSAMYDITFYFSCVSEVQKNNPTWNLIYLEFNFKKNCAFLIFLKYVERENTDNVQIWLNQPVHDFLLVSATYVVSKTNI